MHRARALFALLLGILLAGPGCSKDSDNPLGLPKARVSLHAATPAASDASPDDTSLRPVLLFSVEADSSEDLALDAVIVDLKGTGGASSLSAFRLFRDDGAGSAGVFSASSDTDLGPGAWAGPRATFDPDPNPVIPAGTTADFFVVLAFSTVLPPLAGETFGAGIEADLDVDVLVDATGVAASVDGAPFEGNLVTVVGRLAPSAGSSMPAAAAHQPGATDVAAFQLHLDALDESVLLSSVTFTGAASQGALSDLAGVKLVVDGNGNGIYEPGTDGPFLGATQSFGAGTTVTFAPNRNLAPGTPQDWLVLLDFGAGHAAGDAFTLSFDAAGDVSGAGMTSGRPVFVVMAASPIAGTSQSVAFPALVSIADGGQTPAGGGIASSAQDVVLLHLAVSETTGVEGADLNGLRFVLTGGGTPAGTPGTEIALLELYRDDGDGAFEPGGGPSDDALVSSGAVSGTNDVSLSSLGETIAASGSESYWVSVDLNGAASVGSTYTVSLSSADVGVTGSSTTNALLVTGGPVSGRTVTVNTVAAPQMTLALSAVDSNLSNLRRGLHAQSLGNGPAAVFTLTAPTGEGMSVSSLTLTHGGSSSGTNHVAAVRVYADVGTTAGIVDGSDVLLASASTGFSTGTLTLALPTPRTLAQGASEDWLVTLDLTDACPYARTFTIAVAAAADLSATGLVSSAPVSVTGTPVTSGTRSLEGDWTQITPTGTPPGLPASNNSRVSFAAVYDVQGNRMVIHGGRDDGSTFSFNYFTDVSALDLTAGSEQWSQLNAGGTAGDPPCLRWHAALYHTASSNRFMLIWGGRLPDISMFQPGAVQNNTYRFDLAANTWSQLAVTGTPPNGRVGSGAVWDSANNRMILFGGWEDNANAPQADVWELTLGSTPTWTQLLTNSASGAPSPRMGATCVLDTTTTPARVIVHGGDDGAGNEYTDSFALSLASTPTWSTLSTAQARRTFHAFGFDTSAYQILAFGGYDTNSSSGSLNDLESLDLGLGAPSGTWGYRVTTGTLPTTRLYHQGVWDSAAKRFVIYGGWSGWGTGTPDVWSFR